MHTRSNAHARTHENRRAHRRSAIGGHNEAGRSHCATITSQYRRPQSFQFTAAAVVVGDDKSVISSKRQFWRRASRGLFAIGRSSVGSRQSLDNAPGVNETRTRGAAAIDSG